MGDADVDTSRPNAARMYDYYLGGDANLAVDREAAERVLEIAPEVRQIARNNRDFLARVVKYLCEQGIDQFLDLGSGVPTVGNVHEIAHRHTPHARIAYVDHEPVAVSHARALLARQPNVTITQADIRDPKSVLTAPGVTELLDFSRPIAVLAVAVMHFVPDEEDPAAILATFRDACPRGSYLALSHFAPVTISKEQVRLGRELYNTTATPVHIRDRTQILAMLEGYELVEPGLAPVNHWPTPTNEPVDNGYAAVGFLP